MLLSSNLPAPLPTTCVDVVISGVEGWVKTDYNSLILIVLMDKLPQASQDNGPSELSGLPALTYRTTQVTLRLTTQEISRLVRLDLTPPEFLKLKANHGIFHEIHGDFYDDNGVALQPKREVVTGMDGDQHCAHRDDFINLAESDAGFGYTKEEAIKNLLDLEGEKL